MSAPKKFNGVFTAVVTPFTKSGDIDIKGFDALLEQQLQAGIHGIVPCGTTGESPTLSTAEKKQLIRHTVDKCRGKALVIAATGSNNTRETIELSKSACDLGADALLVVVPYYNKPSQAGLEAHFKAIADASSVPIFLYNVPGRTSISLSATTVGRLATHPRILGIKEASGNLALLTEMRREVLANTTKEFIFLSGDDPTLLPFMTTGGHGVISVASNVIPAAMIRLYKLITQDQLTEALALHESLYPILTNLFIESNPVPCKALLAWHGWLEENFRLPLVSMQSANIPKLKQAWDQLPAAIRKELEK